MSLTKPGIKIQNKFPFSKNKIGLNPSLELKLAYLHIFPKDLYVYRQFLFKKYFS